MKRFLQVQWQFISYTNRLSFYPQIICQLHPRKAMCSIKWAWRIRRRAPFIYPLQELRPNNCFHVRCLEGWSYFCQFSYLPASFNLEMNKWYEWEIMELKNISNIWLYIVTCKMIMNMWWLILVVSLIMPEVNKESCLLMASSQYFMDALTKNKDPSKKDSAFPPNIRSPEGKPTVFAFLPTIALCWCVCLPCCLDSYCLSSLAWNLRFFSCLVIDW